MSVIIAGGGLTGATLALIISSLARGRIPVTLIETALPDTQSDAHVDSRAIALSQGTCQQLIRTGIWPALADQTTPITHIQVTDRGYPGCVNLHAQDYAIAALGYVIELHDARQQLFALLKKAAGVRLCCPARVTGMTRSQQHVTVQLDSGEQLESELLIAADGSSSFLASACNIRGEQRDYQQIAVTAQLMTEKNPAGCAFERFTDTGPLALLPGPQGSSFLVWCHRQADHQTVISWDDRNFLQQLQQAFGWRLGRIVQAGRRHSYPLRSFRASTHISHRLALVGNAAQTLHPIAGQGFNLALRDSVALAEILTKAAQAGTDSGSWSVLDRYQTRRRHDQAMTLSITDGLIDLFTSNYQPLVAGRNIALMLMEHLPVMRYLLARRTLGWVSGKSRP